MIYFFIGIMGGMFNVLAFVLGVIFDRYLLHHTPITNQVDDPTEEEIKQREQLIESQNAFSTLMRYNINDVYSTGVNTDE